MDSQKVIKEAEDKIKELQAIIEKAKQEPIPGKWYIASCEEKGGGTQYTIKLKSFTYRHQHSTGMVYSASRYYFDGCTRGSKDGGFRKIIREATSSEIVNCLLKDIKLNFKIPCSLNYLDKNGGRLLGYNFQHNIDTDTLFASGRKDIIYQDGKFAELINEKIMINQYEVKRVDDQIVIGCKIFNRSFIYDLLEEMNNNKFNEISFDGIKVNKKTIMRITDL